MVEEEHKIYTEGGRNGGVRCWKRGKNVNVDRDEDAWLEGGKGVDRKSVQDRRADHTRPSARVSPTFVYIMQIYKYLRTYEENVTLWTVARGRLAEWNTVYLRMCVRAPLQHDNGQKGKILNKNNINDNCIFRWEEGGWLAYFAPAERWPTFCYIGT